MYYYCPKQPLKKVPSAHQMYRSIEPQQNRSLVNLIKRRNNRITTQLNE